MAIFGVCVKAIVHAVIVEKVVIVAFDMWIDDNSQMTSQIGQVFDHIFWMWEFVLIPCEVPC